jgi:hypothetical protein
MQGTDQDEGDWRESALIILMNKRWFKKDSNIWISGDVGFIILMPSPVFFALFCNLFCLQRHSANYTKWD